MPYDLGMPALFDAEQRLEWSGEWPADGLLDAMERLHWRTMVRWGAGGVRVRRDGGVATVALLEVLPLLRFEDAGDRVEPGLVERRWRIVGGAATREPGGTFALGASRGDGRVAAWVRVEEMPSRFAGLPLVGRLYAAYHALVSNAYLRALRASSSARRS